MLEVNKQGILINIILLLFQFVLFWFILLNLFYKKSFTLRCVLINFTFQAGLAGEQPDKFCSFVQNDLLITKLLLLTQCPGQTYDTCF
jgi:hypothetical protein